MTRYTELRHAGYYAPDASEADKKKIEKEVDKGETRTDPPAESTVYTPEGGTKASTKKS